MLDKADIEGDLARGDPEDLRDTFDALVRWGSASTIVGVARAEELADLFRRVCTALCGDTGRVPGETVRTLLHGRGGTGPLGTYGEAARFALARYRTWWPAFAASFPADD